MMMQRATAIAGALLLSSSLFATPKHVSNSIKYKDSSLPSATGRAGNATIEARALASSDGTVTLDVTTDTGSLEKVQLKSGAGTQNFTGTSGSSFSTNVSGVAPGESLQVQANVSGADGSRTGVVTVSEVVKRRPDLAVVNILSPTRVVYGVPTTVVATIQELNGDLGARATCSLLVNGTPVDRASNIWVDAGDIVHCAFVVTFPAAGSYNLTVALTGTSPGDWDEANNTKSDSVRVIRERDMTSWSATAYQENNDWVSVFTNNARTQGEEQKGRKWWSEMRFDGVFPGEVDPYEFYLSIVETSDNKWTFSSFGGWEGAGGRDGAVCSGLFGRHLTGLACSKDGVVNASMMRIAGFVYYVSRYYYITTNPDGSTTEDTYMVMDFDDSTGFSAPYYSTVSLRFEARPSPFGPSYEANPFIVFQPYDNGTTTTKQCGSNGCAETTRHIYGKRGSDSSDD